VDRGGGHRHVLLVAAWIGWAINVTSETGFTEGLGVLIAWPALLMAALLVCLPLIGIYLLLRRREPAQDDRASGGEESGQPEAEEAQASGTS
jgi:hypothetical protein